MKKTREIKFIYQFAVAILLVFGLSFSCIGTRSSFVSASEYQKNDVVTKSVHSKKNYSYKSYLSRKQFILGESNLSEETLQEEEGEELKKGRTSFQRLLHISLSEKPVYNFGGLWRGRVSSVIKGQFGIAPIIDYIYHSDGKKKYSI